MRHTENWSAAAKGLKEKKRRRRRTFRPFFFLPCHLEAGGVDFASLYIGSFISHPPFLFLPLLRSPRLTTALLLHSRGKRSRDLDEQKDSSKNHFCGGCRDIFEWDPPLSSPVSYFILRPSVLSILEIVFSQAVAPSRVLLCPPRKEENLPPTHFSYRLGQKNNLAQVLRHSRRGQKHNLMLTMHLGEKQVSAQSSSILFYGTLSLASFLFPSPFSLPFPPPLKK